MLEYVRISMGTWEEATNWCCHKQLRHLFPSLLDYSMSPIYDKILRPAVRLFSFPRTLAVMQLKSD